MTNGRFFPKSVLIPFGKRGGQTRGDAVDRAVEVLIPFGKRGGQTLRDVILAGVLS